MSAVELEEDAMVTAANFELEGYLSLAAGRDSGLLLLGEAASRWAAAGAELEARMVVAKIRELAPYHPRAAASALARAAAIESSLGAPASRRRVRRR